MKERFRLYFWLAGANLFISAFTFGGGYVVVPIVRELFVMKKKLLSEKELVEMAAIAQSSPGAIAINMVALSGYHAGGIGGLIVSCICAIIPPLLLLSAISFFYTAFMTNAIIIAMLKAMQAGVAALIIDFITNMAVIIIKERSPLLDLLVVLAFILSYFTAISTILILLGSCLVCLLQCFMKQRA